jgi:hypothetical protein
MRLEARNKARPSLGGPKRLWEGVIAFGEGEHGAHRSKQTVHVTAGP